MYKVSFYFYSRASKTTIKEYETNSLKKALLIFITNIEREEYSGGKIINTLDEEEFYIFDYDKREECIFVGEEIKKVNDILKTIFDPFKI